MSYADLPPDEKGQNRGNARDIPIKLAHVGYVMVPPRNSETAPKEIDPHLIELLAEHEHERWLRAKIKAGWSWADKTDKARKLHKDILPWVVLSDEEMESRYTLSELQAMRNTSPESGTSKKLALPPGEKWKDVILVEAIPDILREAGFEIVSLLTPRIIDTNEPKSKE
jgi:hypothetical protein